MLCEYKKEIVLEQWIPVISSHETFRIVTVNPFSVACMALIFTILNSLKPEIHLIMNNA